MVTSWHLKRFKSVGEVTHFEFAPLTVFAGANSSGKSTVIQSVLLTTQTLQSPVLQRPVVLNGHMARLGSFLDIVTGADPDETIEIGFTLTLEPGAFRRPPQSGVWRDYGGFWWGSGGSRMSIDCRYGFGMRETSEKPEALGLQPNLEFITFGAAATPEGEDMPAARGSISARRSNKSIHQRIQELHLSVELTEPIVQTLEYEVTRLSPQASPRDTHDLVGRRNVGIGLRHFLPAYMAVMYDAVGTEVERVVSALTERVPFSSRDLGSTDLASNLKQPVVKAVLGAALSDFLDHLPEHMSGSIRSRQSFRAQALRVVDELRSGEDVDGFVTLLRSLPPSLRGGLSQAFLDREDSLRNAIRRGRAPRQALDAQPLPDVLGEAASLVQRFFGTAVQYLGPLRDEPKAVYPLSGSTDPSDVGFRGEHTAAVLEIHKSTPVETVSPSHFVRDEPGLPPIQVRPLIDATLEWLQYMGVGSGLDTEDRGKLGHDLRVATADDAPLHDLTQVGVGVSQVLPILVMSLLADRGATLIFEQPELHLHPRVQSRLADFFVALISAGKQCLVETHSEYLINQLRFRSVISEGQAVSDQIRIYFVEKERGQSRYRAVKINPYGVIEDWPRGFFDEKERTASAIMRAAVEKRRREQGM